MDTVLPASIDEAGVLRFGPGSVVPRPRTLLRPPPPPSRRSTTSRGSPVICRSAPRDRTPWAGEGFPSSCIHRRTVPLPIPRRVLRRCTVRFFTPSVAFAVTHPARLPLVPQRGCYHEAAEFASCCGPVLCSPKTGFRHCASARGTSPRHRQSATGLPGDYPDRTSTGRRMQAYGHFYIRSWASPPR